jgi:hypothetical protein
MSFWKGVGASMAVSGVIGYNWLRIQERRRRLKYDRVPEGAGPYDKHLPDALELSTAISDASEFGL